MLTCLSAARRPTAGELVAFGTRLHDASPRAVARFRAETVAVMGQHPAQTLPDVLPVGDAVARRLRLRGAGRRFARRRAAELLAGVGLDGRAAARRPRELSGGQQQR
ncbi:MAG TPA: ATP-binding cassette domain-containing protein, partial [Solirubrobacteraceae bacterium]